MKYWYQKFFSLFNKIYYFFFSNKSFVILKKIFNFIKNYFSMMFYILEEDIYVLGLKIDSFKNIYSEFGLIKHLLFIFFLITGVIPVIFFIYISFFFFKYLLKYIFISLDFFYFSDHHNKYYEKLRDWISLFFFQIPELGLKFYRYFFGGGWMRFFIDKFKDYWRNKWYKFLDRFFRVTDHFLLVYLPKKWDNFTDKIIDFYHWSMFTFLKTKNILKENIRENRKQISRILRYFRKNLRSLKRSYLSFYRKYYFFFYFKSMKVYAYYAWFFKKYLFSEVCLVTIEAFCFISFWDFVACVIYINKLVYHRIAFIIVGILHPMSEKLITFRLTLEMIFDYLKSYGFYGRFYLKRFYLWLVSFFIYYFGMLLMYSTYYHHNQAIALRIELYEVEFGFRSYVWYNIKFYSIIYRFFRRLRPTWLKLFIFDRKFDRILLFMIIDFHVDFISNRIIEEIWWYYIYRTFVIKVIDLWYK